LAVVVRKEIGRFRLEIGKNLLDSRTQGSALAAAFPASTGIDTLSNIRITVLLLQETMLVQELCFGRQP
jgi:hypothetical protein